MRKHKSTVWAVTVDMEVEPCGQHPEGGFLFRPVRAGGTGSLQGQACATGKLLGQILGNPHLDFEKRADLAAIVNKIMCAHDRTGEARRALHLATRERSL